MLSNQRGRFDHYLLEFSTTKGSVLVDTTKWCSYCARAGNLHILTEFWGILWEMSDIVDQLWSILVQAHLSYRHPVSCTASALFTAIRITHSSFLFRSPKFYHVQVPDTKCKAVPDSDFIPTRSPIAYIYIDLHLYRQTLLQLQSGVTNVRQVLNPISRCLLVRCKYKLPGAQAISIRLRSASKPLIRPPRLDQLRWNEVAQMPLVQKWKFPLNTSWLFFPADPSIIPLSHCDGKHPPASSGSNSTSPKLDRPKGL